MTRSLNRDRCRPRLASRHLSGRARLIGAAMVGAALCATSAVRAEDWRWSITPYAWLTDVGVDLELEDGRLFEGDVAFEDLLEDLDTVFQLRAEAQRGAHGIVFDLFDVQLSEEGTHVPVPIEGGGEAVLDSVVGMTILELGGLFDPRGDQEGFALLYGTRILAQRAEIGARFELFPAMSASESWEAEETLADALFGVRYLRPLSRRWSYQMRADASAGSTELTWSAESAFAWELGADGSYALHVGYRHMAVDFASEDAADVDLTLTGPLLGFRISF